MVFLFVCLINCDLWGFKFSQYWLAFMYLQWYPLLSLCLAVPHYGCSLQFWNILVLEHSFPRMHHSLSVYKSYSLMLAPRQFFSIRASCLTAFFGLFRKCHLLPVSASAFDPKSQFIRSDFIFKDNVIYIFMCGGVKLYSLVSTPYLFLWLLELNLVLSHCFCFSGTCINAQSNQ